MSTVESAAAERKLFIAVAGNIGVGKSTLTDMLARRFGWEPFYEAVNENPYLSDFYKDMRAWSFQSQVFFLTRRMHHIQEIRNHPTPVIQDRSIYEDAEIFARNLRKQKKMAKRDWRVYRELYEELTAFLPVPDLVIYLRASVETLLTRIRKRGRGFEKSIDFEYLDQLNRHYERWARRFTLCPMLVVPADSLDFVAYESHLDLIVRRVQACLGGQPPTPFCSEEIIQANVAAD